MYPAECGHRAPRAFHPLCSHVGTVERDVFARERRLLRYSHLLTKPQQSSESLDTLDMENVHRTQGSSFEQLLLLIAVE